MVVSTVNLRGARMDDKIVQIRPPHPPAGGMRCSMGDLWYPGFLVVHVPEPMGILSGML